jgi:hypothetical protein
MKRNATGQEEIKQRLQEAIEGLRKDATRVEIWATALGTFAEPVPEYQPDSRFRLGKSDFHDNENAVPERSELRRKTGD